MQSNMSRSLHGKPSNFKSSLEKSLNIKNKPSCQSQNTSVESNFDGNETCCSCSRNTPTSAKFAQNYFHNMLKVYNCGGWKNTFNWWSPTKQPNLNFFSLPRKPHLLPIVRSSLTNQILSPSSGIVRPWQEIGNRERISYKTSHTEFK